MKPLLATKPASHAMQSINFVTDFQHFQKIPRPFLRHRKVVRVEIKRDEVRVGCALISFGRSGFSPMLCVNFREPMIRAIAILVVLWDMAVYIPHDKHVVSMGHIPESRIYKAELWIVHPSNLSDNAFCTDS